MVYIYLSTFGFDVTNFKQSWKLNIVIVCKYIIIKANVCIENYGYLLVDFNS